MANASEREEYSQALVDFWDEYIDWDRRRQGEDGFLANTLKASGCRKILDASLGTGCDSIYLLQQGFDVTSNEIDAVFAKKALENAAGKKVQLKVTSYDWREFDEKFERDFFDAIILQGNSFTHLFKKQNRLRALSAFKNVLQPDGILIIDERNYGNMLSEKEKILKGDFRYSGKYVYCGKNVRCTPVEIEQGKVVLKIAHQDGRAGCLCVYPFKDGELLSLIRQAGFAGVKQYSDFRKGHDRDADFFQYVAKK